VRRLTLALLVPGLLGLGACAGQHVIIDWIDFVQWNGVTYVTATSPASTRAIEPALGPQLSTTKRKLDGNETDPSHKIQEGEAAFLEAGTPIYSVSGYRPAFRIGVKKAGATVIYEADTNPKAKNGADLLDLEGKVDHIGIGDANNQLELGAIREAAVVAHLVGLILQAPVDQSAQPPPAGPQYFLTFHFHDGTQTVRAFWPSTGLLSRGILTSPEFGRAIQGALPSPAA
jgi:hypothetical protein